LRGTRPVAARDQSTASTYIFGAICPKHGKGAGLVLPKCNSHAMNLHLAEISATVAPGAHAVVLLDQAGWHLSAKLLVPSNITLVPLPAKCPELNAIENVWQYIRDNWLSNRLPQWQEHRRSLLRRAEQADRPTLVYHVNRLARLGTWVLVNGIWYKAISR
jgi:hypothetical protein